MDARRPEPGLWLDPPVPQRMWRKSAEGNFHLNAQGCNIAVSLRPAAWSVHAENRDTGLSEAGRKTYPTREAAKAAALEALERAPKHL